MKKIIGIICSVFLVAQTAMFAGCGKEEEKKGNVNELVDVGLLTAQQKYCRTRKKTFLITILAKVFRFR